MVERCRELHREGRRTAERIHSFAGLEFYEAAAEADYERMDKEQTGQLKLALRAVREEQWRSYEAFVLGEAKLDEAEEEGWTVVSMKSDWNRIFPFEE